jgi:large subunit ribosomal protein L15
MKLNDLRPAPGSHRRRTRVGRGIAAGKGKTAGRGTKGQKSRAGASIPPFFEGGQTPLSQRVPKLRGFKRRWRIEYEVVNVGRLCQAVEAGRLGQVAGDAPVVVTPETLAAAGLIRTEHGVPRPVKLLGHGDCTVRLHVVADAFTRSAAAKIEAAGGTAQVAEVPAEAIAAIVAEEAAGEDEQPPAPLAPPAPPAPLAPPAPAARKPARRVRAAGPTESAPDAE